MLAASSPRRRCSSAMRVRASSSITADRSEAKSSACPTRNVSTAPARRVLSSSAMSRWTSTLAAAEHFCPAKPNALLTIAGTASSRSASASTMMQFLPPISAITRLTWRWPAGGSAAARMMLSRGAGAGEGDRVHFGWATSALPARRRPGSNWTARRRHAGGVQRLDERPPAGGRLLRGLEDDGVAGAECRRRPCRSGSRAGSSRARSLRRRRAAK